MYLCGGSPDFFYFHIWLTEVIPYNALNSEFANFETPYSWVFLIALSLENK
jgi:hypothetical protein